MTLNVMLFTYKREQKKICRTVIYLDNNHAFGKSIKNIKNSFSNYLINTDNLN